MAYFSLTHLLLSYVLCGSVNSYLFTADSMPYIIYILIYIAAFLFTSCHTVSYVHQPSTFKDFFHIENKIKVYHRLLQL
jgi:hypothetical protein